MEIPNFKEVGQLFEGLILPFLEIERDMRLPLSTRRTENDAEHSWSLSLIACSLAERIDESLDVGRIAELCVVHDLVEIRAGDTSVWDTEGQKTKADREEMALTEIRKDYADFSWLVAAIEEYEAKSSPEAIYVNAVDKYVAIYTRMLDCQAGNHFYVDDVPLTIEQFKERIAVPRQKAHAQPVVGELFDEVYSIFLSHPEWFADEASKQAQ